ncbi:MAG: response regulator [Lysobacterales bacterium]|jgi:FixJ family two-component response regulator
MSTEPLVCIIDDDEAIRESLRLLLYAGDLTSCYFESADAFLAAGEIPPIDCMLLDIRMPGTDGLELFRILQTRQLGFPVIFITGHGDIPLAVEAIKQGAYDFLTKPFGEGEIIGKVQAAIEDYRAGQRELAELQDLRERVASCTPREREVMELLARGLPNKGVADSLGISPRTVEIHRANVMQKMSADSLPSLVRMVTLLESRSAVRNPSGKTG